MASEDEASESVAIADTMNNADTTQFEPEEYLNSLIKSSGGVDEPVARDDAGVSESKTAAGDNDADSDSVTGN